MTATSASSRRRASSDPFSTVLSNILEVPQHVTGDDDVGTALRAQLDRLPKAWHDKLGALLNLGRRVHERSHVYSSVAEGHAVTPLDASALCDKQTRVQQYLERGLAMMCAESLDLEGGEALIQRGERKASVFERAWSHFGRELAGSEPGEWSWVAQRASGADRLEKLYLKRGNGAWWSFGANLDRPRKTEVKTRNPRPGKRRRGDSGVGLQALVSEQYSQRRALQRAMRSVHARMGIISARHAAVAKAP